MCRHNSAVLLLSAVLSTVWIHVCLKFLLLLSLPAELQVFQRRQTSIGSKLAGPFLTLGLLVTLHLHMTWHVCIKLAEHASWA